MSRQRKKEPISIEGEKITSKEVARLHVRIFESELLVALIACLFLGTGISLALLALTTLEFTFFTVLGFALIAIIVIAAVSLKWWIPVVFFGALVSIFVVYHLYNASFNQWISFWTGFAGWVIEGAPYRELYSEGFTLELLQFLIILPVLSVLYPFIRRPVLFPALVVLSTGIVITSYILNPADMSVIICMGITGIIILLPGVYARFVKKTGEVDKKATARMQMVAVPAALVVLLAFWITPEDTSGWRSRTMTAIANDIAYLFRGPFNTWPPVVPNFSMYDLGFQTERDRLGGPAELNDDSILVVTSPVDVLLKGRVYDKYTGINWEVGRPDGDFRYESFLWRGYRREALGQDRPMGGNRTARYYDEIMKDIDIEITYTTSRYRALFTTGRIKSINLTGSQDIQSIFFNMRSEMYTHERISYLQRARLRTTVWENSRPDFDRLFLELEKVAMYENDTRFNSVLERYTILPEDLPYYVRELTAEITKDDETAYSKVMSLIAWLNENCEYTLEPDIVPEGEDFVEYFLKTREGYCTYFATALAVMARCEGIPTRYVIGFALEEGRERQVYRATGETAHAWTEVYFKGIGWVEIDPLRWSSEAPLNSGESIERPVEPPVTAPQTPQAPPENQEEPDDTIDEEPDLPGDDIYWLIIIPVGAVTLVVLTLVTIRSLLTRKNRQFALIKVYAKFKNNSLCLDVYYSDILKQLALLDLTPLPGETLRQFSKRVDARIDPGNLKFAAVAESIADHRYAGIEPNREQVETANDYHRALEKYLFEWLGKWVYIIKRAIR